jgi:hypothetical protein
MSAAKISIQDEAAIESAGKLAQIEDTLSEILQRLDVWTKENSPVVSESAIGTGIVEAAINYGMDDWAASAIADGLQKFYDNNKKDIPEIAEAFTTGVLRALTFQL